MAYQAKSPLAAFQQMHTLTVKLTRPFDKKLSQKIQRKEFLPEWMRPKTQRQQAQEAEYIRALHNDLLRDQEQQRGGNPQQISHPAPFATSQQMARLLQLPYRQQPPQYQQPPRYQKQQPPPYQQAPAYTQRGRGIIRH
jgi:hypothetical protein